MEKREERPDGYRESIEKGLGVRKIFRPGVSAGTGSRQENLQRLKSALREAEAVVIGAGAGLSTSAGFTYSGDRFRKYFGDFSDEYRFYDMYAGGFYPFPSEEEFWGFWSRNIYINRYVKPPVPVYERVLDLVRDKNYFVITTNVDHQFQKAGVKEERLFFTQGDYGLWQCGTPCHQRTYDNKSRVVKMLLSQGFAFGPAGELLVPEKEDGSTDFSALSRAVSPDLVPVCPVCGEPMKMNLRADDSFVEDEDWKAASARYAVFLKENAGKRILFLELGVGMNTPVIMKYPFWVMTAENPKALYACLNLGEAYTPKDIEEQSVCLDGDIADTLEELRGA